MLVMSYLDFAIITSVLNRVFPPLLKIQIIKNMIILVKILGGSMGRHALPPPVGPPVYI